MVHSKPQSADEERKQSIRQISVLGFRRQLQRSASEVAERLAAEEDHSINGDPDGLCLVSLGYRMASIGGTTRRLILAECEGAR